jgi:predicted naringenin-chalcone synthase
MSYLVAMGTANPPHQFSQSSIARFMERAMNLNPPDARKLQALFRATGIETRHSVLSDYGKDGAFDFFANSPSMDPFPSTAQRMEVYKTEAISISAQAARSCLQRVDVASITHLVTVSCTGQYAPGLDIDLVKALGLPRHVERTNINFMGCYAAFNALKVAHAVCSADPAARVLVVCVELCSLHFQHQNTEDNMLANALFADGAAAMLVQGEALPGINLKPLSFYCDLAMEGEQDMAWSVGDRGFEMKLSAYVPQIIQKGIGDLTQQLLARVRHRGPIDFLAIHPGGRKILSAIEQAMGIDPGRNRFAYEVLRKFGNMSSPTVVFVLDAIFRQLSEADNGKTILSFAFGPGLTLESALFAIEIQPQ